jgi:hypothetical protein
MLIDFRSYLNYKIEAKDFDMVWHVLRESDSLKQKLQNSVARWLSEEMAHSYIILSQVCKWKKL